MTIIVAKHLSITPERNCFTLSAYICMKLKEREEYLCFVGKQAKIEILTLLNIT